MVLAIAQIFIAIAIIVLILLQERSVGLSGIFGGGGGDDAGFYQTRRGLEKIIFRATIVLVVLFVALSIFNLLN